MTLLQHLGNVLKKILHIAIVIATDAEPIVALVDPAIAPLYNSVLGLAISEEATAATATGTGAQKLANLVAKLVPQAQAWAEQNHIDWPESEISAWASAVVDTFNKIPAPASSSVPSAAAVPAA